MRIHARLIVIFPGHYDKNMKIIQLRYICIDMESNFQKK